jgi:4Fe-4S ferredoxin
LSGEISRLKSRNEIQLKRSLLTREYLLRLNRNLCDGCGVCAENCPKGSIIWYPPSVINGRLIRKPAIDFDIDSCILCGECVTLCPIDAMKMEIDGEDVATIVKNEAFPVLLKEVKVNKEMCGPECDLKCRQECPTEAINISTGGSKNKAAIVDVQVDESLCIYCKRCEAACPFDAIKVKKPFLGTIKINTDSCPKGCRACVDICPAHSASLDKNGKTQVSREFCVYCFACQKVCPEQAILVKREWIFHSDVRSACWLTALKKLTSIKTVSKELASTSGKRRFSRVHTRVGGSGEE